MAALDEESSMDLRQNRNLGVYKGAVYENIVSEALAKQGYQLYYYKTENAQLEMDFFVRDSTTLIPVEVKATTGATPSLKGNQTESPKHWLQRQVLHVSVLLLFLVETMDGKPAVKNGMRVRIWECALKMCE